MARELKGYAAKRARGLVPFRYEGRLRSVQPPVGQAESLQHERSAHWRAGRTHPADRGNGTFGE